RGPRRRSGRRGRGPHDPAPGPPGWRDCPGIRPIRSPAGVHHRRSRRGAPLAVSDPVAPSVRTCMRGGTGAGGDAALVLGVAVRVPLAVAVPEAGPAPPGSTIASGTAAVAATGTTTPAPSGPATPAASP